MRDLMRPGLLPRISVTVSPHYSLCVKVFRRISVVLVSAFPLKTQSRS
jgi:hypothetical protein